MLIIFLRKLIFWSINKIRPDITVCVKIDHSGNFTVLLAGWILEWKRKKFWTKAEDRHQKHVCSPTAFLEVWSVWGLNSRKWMIQNYFKLWELFRARSEQRRACHTRTTAAYCYQVFTFCQLWARPSIVICRLSSSLHDLAPLLPFEGPSHWRRRTSRATSRWKYSRDAERAVILANTQQRKLLRHCNRITWFLGLFIICTCNSLIFSSEAD